jgi:hypothetical protein
MTSVESRAQIISPGTGKIRKISISLTTAPGSGNSRSFNVRVNSVNQTTVTVSDTDTTSSTALDISLAEFDLVSVQGVNGSAVNSAGKVALVLNITN